MQMTQIQNMSISINLLAPLVFQVVAAMTCSVHGDRLIKYPFGRKPKIPTQKTMINIVKCLYTITLKVIISGRKVLSKTH